MSDLKQGVTLEIFGEGTSPGPFWKDKKFTSFGEAMQNLESNGVAVNIASFLGAATTRILEVGYDNRPATDEEMERMRGHVKDAMKFHNFHHDEKYSLDHDGHKKMTKDYGG